MSNELPLLSDQGVGLFQDDETLSYLSMPSSMHRFMPPVLPEPDVLNDAPQTLAVLAQLQDFLEVQTAAATSQCLLISDLPISDIRLLQQVLGEGEVAIQIQAPSSKICIQETVLAGLWWGQQLDAADHVVQQWLEVGAMPSVVLRECFAAARWPKPPALPEGLVNGGPVLIELLDAAALHSAETAPHVVNLSLLPFSAEDHAFLADQLGQGTTSILSRGYGNCRIVTTATPNIWRVQYFNSTDQLILDTLEVTAIPQVACAADEDLRDSAERLREMREVLVYASV